MRGSLKVLRGFGDDDALRVGLEDGPSAAELLGVTHTKTEPLKRGDPRFG